MATRGLARDHRPDLTDTAPAALIAPCPQWADAAKIVSLDPWGHLVGEVFAEHIRAGIDARPTMAITTARLAPPELRPLLAEGRLRADGRRVRGLACGARLAGAHTLARDRDRAGMNTVRCACHPAK